MRYALLLAPSANRVYTQAAPALAEAELKAFGGLDIRPPIVLGGHAYLVFETEPVRLAALANLSSAYAFFELVDDELLRPVAAQPLDRFDDDLITIPKYAGKTNEHFTKLLLNVTVNATRWDFLGRRFTILDPVAGRGTTLNQALMYGWNAVGIEHDRKDFEAYEAFLKTYLRRKRIKHSADVAPVRREGKRIGRRLDVTVRDEQTVTMFEADTTLARSLMKVRSVDAIVGDLPYGVVHRAGDLLRAALPGWVELLRPGGAVGVSWNTHAAPRKEAVAMLEAHGLTVLEAGYEHWVDQGITRDIVVGQKLV
ncbi:TRM11 family SAM-dependent methyltransferase [Allorhizocola rhizosphaerae]|uniref:TRM11 family SAM-dependent methyltransferase n=1 Tax=Allorhizocola rhizosphaerae TaxID=1872709 RepID=UPI000E3C4924|nr:SAM-dependent methyltransferase [Allorhizocola rhizosphaerae]